jgi:hypothetical protein
MSTTIGGKIVTDGLVIHYDALNGKSYPGSGVTWNDLTSYNNNGDLDNGDNPVTISNGYASFTGTDNDKYVNIDSIGEINDTTDYATVDMWIKLKNPIAPSSNFYAGYIFGWNGYSISATGWLSGVNEGKLRFLGFSVNSTETYGVSGSYATELEEKLVNQWNHYSFVFANGNSSQGNLPVTEQKIYINSINQSIGAVSTGWIDFPTNRLFSFGDTSIARFPGRRNTGGQNLLINMDVALIKIYNRKLTQAEVTQNFNAHKGRFNIY